MSASFAHVRERRVRLVDLAQGGLLPPSHGLTPLDVARRVASSRSRTTASPVLAAVEKPHEQAPRQRPLGLVQMMVRRHRGSPLEFMVGQGSSSCAGGRAPGVLMAHLGWSCAGLVDATRAREAVAAVLAHALEALGRDR